MDSLIGAYILMEGLESELRIVNIYDPYYAHKTFWESLFKGSLLCTNNLINGGDLNFSLGATEVWGTNVCIDDHSLFFTYAHISRAY
jgi:hypothetical protein